MTKLRVLSALSLLLISGLCSVSSASRSASLRQYDADDTSSRGGLRGQGHQQEQEGASTTRSESLTKRKTDEEEESIPYREGSSSEYSETDLPSSYVSYEPIEDSEAKRNENPGTSDPTDGRGYRKDKQGRIIGGYEAKPNLHSYAVSLFDKVGHFCGGSLITRNCILTAAHCQGGRYSVALGRHDLRTNEGQEIRMKKELPHPNYDEFTTDFDFMLVFLRSPATLNGKVSLVKLNDDPSVPYVGESVTPMGWGDIDRRDDVSKLSDKLMKVQVNVISRRECDDSSGTIDGYHDSYNGQITQNMLCASSPRKDSCQGDSGGPLVTTYGEKQVGVVSWGIGCASEHFPGVYARVSRVHPWIQREVCRENKKYATEAGFRC